MSAFVICLVVIGAAIAVVRTVDRDQPATAEPISDRDPHPPARRPRHLAAGGLDADERTTTAPWPSAQDVDVPAPVAQRVRSGALLAMLLIGLGALAASAVGVLVVLTLTAVRTAIG